MVHTFITRRIDYCNSLLQDVSEVHLRPLQNVLNSAVCIILWKQRLDHITADIRDLVHWLPVQQRIEYKMCVLIYKCLHQSTPLRVMHPGCSNRQSESFTASSARQPRHLLLWDKAIWTKKFCLFRTGSLELTPTDSS